MSAVAYGRSSNELDVLLQDLSNARYAGGGPQLEKTEEQFTSSTSSTTFVHKINGYHPKEQIVTLPQYDKSLPAMIRPTPQSDALIKELESVMTEEETVVEESREYSLEFGDNFRDRRRDQQKPLHSTTTIRHVGDYNGSIRLADEEYLVDDLVHNLDGHRMRQSPVEIPIDMTVPITITDIHQDFSKPELKEAQMHANYKRIHVDETAQVEKEEVAWVMEDVPEPPKRPEPPCAACSRPISGRCITAMMRKFHPEHFVCSYCLKQLNKGTFKEREDKPYCQECFYRLFG